MIQTHLGKLSYFCSPNILRFGLLGRWAFSFFFPLNYSNFLWLVWGQNTSPNPKHIPESKHFLEFKNTCQNPKPVPESKNSSKNPKYFLESKTRPRIQKQFQESKILPRIQNTFEFWDGFLDSGKCFWIVIVIRKCPQYFLDTL